ncbi:spike glycoprotein [Bellinger River virus]|uniref:Spike glycoprotein n=1 Tax=Bellinger River virus TaxID=2301728 RepID=A0A346I7I8_9NIDO|nr:spike glycoprotein [Bellinger River virus]AXP11708.1 spike glycoprotein [Bellinger River virus]
MFLVLLSILATCECQSHRYDNWDKVFTLDNNIQNIISQKQFDNFLEQPFLINSISNDVKPTEIVEYLTNNQLTQALPNKLPHPVISSVKIIDKQTTACNSQLINCDTKVKTLTNLNGNCFFFNPSSISNRSCYKNKIWRVRNTNDNSSTCDNVYAPIGVKTITQDGKQVPLYYHDILPQLYEPGRIVNDNRECCIFKTPSVECKSKAVLAGGKITNYINTFHETIIQCPCAQKCVIFINSQIDVLISDGILIKSTFELENLHNIKDQHTKSILRQQQPETSKLERQYLEFNNNCGDSITKAGCELETIEFSSSIYMIHNAVMPNTIFKTFCAVEKLPINDQLEPLNSKFSVPATVQLGKQRYIAHKVNPVTFQLDYTNDPDFISATTTTLPTIGSCRRSDGYAWHGNFSIEKNEARIEDCTATTLDWNPVCNITKLEPLVKVYAVDKKITAKGVNCDDICPYAVLCSEEQKRSPIYQACLAIEQDISTLLKVERPTSVKMAALTKTEPLAGTIDVNFLQEVAKVQAQRFDLTVETGLDHTQVLDDLFKLTVALPQDSTFFPDRSQAAIDLGLFQNAMFNSKADMDHVAAFPWLAGWRFGRQINGLSYTTSNLIRSYRQFSNTVNKNFQQVATALSAMADQITMNYEVTTRLYESIQRSYQAYENNFAKIDYRMSEIEFMTAKLSLINQYFTKIATRQSQLASEHQIFDLRVGSCRTANPACFGGQGVYLAHAEFETPSQKLLIVNYLGSTEKCKQVFTANKICTKQGTATIAPFGCAFFKTSDSDSEVLRNLKDNGPCHVPPINVQDCQLPTNEIIQLQLINYQETLELGIRQVNLTRVEFNQKIANISTFNNNIKQLVNSIDKVPSLGDMLEKQTIASLNSIIAQINAWSIWDIIKWFLVCGVIIAFSALGISVIKLVTKR